MRILAWAAGALTSLALAGSAMAHNPTEFGHLGAHTTGLPDLAASPVEEPYLETYQFGGTGPAHLMLRFNGYIYNRGPGGLEIRGDTRQGSVMTRAFQRVYQQSGPPVDRALPSLPNGTLHWDTGDGHHHWHLRNAARYTLVSTGGGAATPAGKVGFCLVDSESEPYFLGPSGDYVDPEWNGTSHGECQRDTDSGTNGLNASSVGMGLTPHWRDLYPGGVAYQWVDVSDVQPGPYRLRAEVDPDGMIEETNETNAPSFVDVTLPGYRAKPVAATGLPTLTPSTITLDRDTFTGGPLDRALAAPQFRVDTAPADGDLNVPTGTWFSGSQVTYTPRPGTDGNDSFTFSVRETGQGYPHTPTPAAVAIALSGPVPPAEQVVLSGAPESLYTSTTATLDAVVTNPRAGTALIWTVNGVTGGDATVGRIAPDPTTPGRAVYTAPQTVPSPAAVTLSATTPSGKAAGATVRVVAAPVIHAPAPLPPAPATTPTVTPPQAPRPTVVPKPAVTPPAIGTPRAARVGRFLVVSFTPGRSGRARTSVYKGSRRVGLCRAPVTAGRGYTCRLRAPRGRRTRLRVALALTRNDGRTVATRTLTVR